MVRTLASHQCGPGSNPSVNSICGLGLLLVLSLAPRGISAGTLVFPSFTQSGTDNHVETRRDVKNTYVGASCIKKLQFTITI